MGIYKSFNQLTGKWEWKYFMGVKSYNTETECDADKANVWELHMAKLNAWRFTCNMLGAYR